MDGLGGHITDLHSHYKQQYWFFEGIEYARKLLLIGIIPAASKGQLWGAVVALFVIASFSVLLVALSPYSGRLDNALASCINAMLFIVIQLSVLLKMDAAYLSSLVADGISPGAAAYLLVAANAAVVIMSVAGYFVSMWQAGLFRARIVRLFGQYKTSIQDRLLEHQYEQAETGGDVLSSSSSEDEGHYNEQQ